MTWATHNRYNYPDTPHIFIRIPKAILSTALYVSAFAIGVIFNLSIVTAQFSAVAAFGFFVTSLVTASPYFAEISVVALKVLAVSSATLAVSFSLVLVVSASLIWLNSN